MRRGRWVWMVVGAALVAACKGTEPGPGLATITVSAPAVQLDVGEHVQATASAFAPGGAQVNARGIRWTSSDTLVANVSSTGDVVAEGPGTATIVASSGSVSGSLEVRVEDRAHSLVFTGTTMPSSIISDTAAVAAVVRDSALAPMAGRRVKWTSRDPAIATVNASGVIVGQAKGRTWIVAHSGRAVDSVEMWVASGRGSASRQIAYRTTMTGAPADEIWLWGGFQRNTFERVSERGRVLRSHRWSADGQWLVVSYRGTPTQPPLIEVLQPDRGGRVQVTAPGARDGDLSPDNTWIAMSIATSGGQAIAIVRTDNTDLRQLTSLGGYAISPLWAPDGRQLAFLRTSGPEETVGELWTMAPDGASPKRLATAARNITWSPDAKQLAFDDGDVVWIVRRDGTGLTAASPAPNPNLATINGRPRWSPDAHKLVYAQSGELRVVSSSGSLISAATVDPSLRHADFSARHVRLVRDVGGSQRHDAVGERAPGGPPDEQCRALPFMATMNGAHGAPVAVLRN